MDASPEPGIIRVLHVDDEPDFAEMTASFLERRDERFDVETASDAAGGIAYLDEGVVDCVISDFDMPERNGIEFLRTVREDYPDLPFILYTGKGSEEVASEAVSAGVTDYLQKTSGTSQYTVLANRIKNAVDQYRSKRDAEASRKRLSLLFEQSPLGVIEWNEDLEFTRVNDTAEEILGYTEEELVGEPWKRIVPPGDQESVSAALSGMLAGDRDDLHINENVRKDGERIVCEWHNRAARDKHGTIGAVYSQFRDITERRGREAELRRNERRYRAIFNDPNILVALLDTDGSVIDVNETAMAYIDATLDEVRNEPFRETPWFDHSETARREVEEWIDRARRGEYVEFEADRVRSDGTAYTVDGVFRPVTDENGDIVSLLISSRDITHRKVYEERLEALNRATRKLLTAETPTAVAEIGVEVAREVLGLEANAIHLYDAERSELPPVAVTDAVRDLVGDPPAFTGDDSIAWRVFKDGNALAVDDIHTDADRYNPNTPVESELYLPIGDHGILIAGSPTPAAFDQEDILLGEILAGNVAAALEQVERTEQLRETTAELEERTEELEAVSAELESQYRLLFEEAPIMTVVARQRDGGLFIEDCNDQFAETLGISKEDIIGSEVTSFYTAESKSTSIAEDGHQRALNGEFGTQRRQLQTASGDVIETLLRAVPNHNAEGEVIGTISMYVDITERAELERVNERLEEFAGIVSHDLRNPLQVAEGRVELAREEVTSEHLAAVARAHDRMDALIEDLLALAREDRGITETETVELASLVENCWTNVETAGGRLIVETNASVVADSPRLKQLFENLIRNAVEHGGNDVTVTIGDLPNGFYIADDGDGVPESEREAIFETGYSTSKDGTGIGLSIVERIVDAHNWAITVTKSESSGARFEITGVKSSSE